MPDDARDRAFARARESLLVANQAPAMRQHRVRTPFAVAAAATLLIAAAGAAALQMQGRIVTPPAPIAAPSAGRPTSPAPAPSADSVAPSPPESAAPSPVVKPSRRPHAHGIPQASPDELPLLRKAREAVGRHGYAEAMATLVEHEARFPASCFVEERDALKVRALSGSGRMEEARRAAEVFRAHFPHSVLLPRMNDVIRLDKP